MRRGTTIIFLFGLFFVCVIGAIGYFLTHKNISIYKQSKRVNTPSASVVLSESLPQEVSIIEKNNAQILQDERVGYKMQIPNDTRIKTRDGSVLFYKTDAFLLGGIHIFENPNNLTLEEWLSELNTKEGFTFYQERQKLRINNVEVIKIPVEGEIETYEYFFKKDTSIVGITLPARDDFNQYIQSVQLIN